MPKTRARHTWVARAAAATMVIVFVSGFVSAVALRGWRPLDTAHGWLALGTMVLFSTAATLGWLLQWDRTDKAALHGALGVISFLLTLAVAVAGIELLP